MKRIWSLDELDAVWRLLPPEQELLVNKHESTRLGFAVLLKFFQAESRFPASPREVPKSIVKYVATQLGRAVDEWKSYPWQGPTIKRHRREIRDWSGFREATAADRVRLKQWLVREILPHEHHEVRLQEALLQRCRELYLEPPAAKLALRLVISAQDEYGRIFGAKVLQQVGSAVPDRLSALLRIPTAEDGEGPGKTPWQTLKEEPGKAGVESVREGIARLALIREVGLPDVGSRIGRAKNGLIFSESVVTSHGQFLSKLHGSGFWAQRGGLQKDTGDSTQSTELSTFCDSPHCQGVSK